MMRSNRVSREVLESVLPDLKVLEFPPSERDELRIAAAAAACAELSFLRSLEPEELQDACRRHLRVDRLRAGEAVHLQGMEATAAFVVLSGTVSCHVRKDLIDIEGGAHLHMQREWKERELAKAKEEAAKAKARHAYLEASGAGIEPAAVAENVAAAAEATAAAAAKGSLLSSLPPGKYMMLPTMEPEKPAAAASPPPSSSGKLGLRQRLTRASLTLGLSSTLSAGEVRSRASRLVGVCLTLHNTGDSFGEPSLTSSNRRASTAVCDTACTLLVCPRQALAAMAGAAREVQTLEWMRSVPTLAMCSPPTLTQMLQAARRRAFAWSEPIVRAGDKAPCLYLVLSGELRLSRATSRPQPLAAPMPTAVGASYSPVNSPPLGASAPPSPTATTYRLASACDGAEGGAAGGGDSNTPRDMTLRTIGSGQMIPCVLAATSSLGDGVRFPYTARVASAHSQLLLLDCRMVGLLLSRQDNGRALGELTTLLQSDARRMEQLATATEERWLTDLVTAKLVVAPATPVPPSKPLAAQAAGSSASPRVASRPASGQRRPPQLLPGPASLPRSPPPPDPAVSGHSKWFDPSRPGTLPLPPRLEPAQREDTEAATTGNMGEVMDPRSSPQPPPLLASPQGAEALEPPRPPAIVEGSAAGSSELTAAEGLPPQQLARQPAPPGGTPPAPSVGLAEPANLMAALCSEVAAMEAVALEQSRQLQAMLTPRPLRPKPDPKAISKMHPSAATPSERQRAVAAYLQEANTLRRPASSAPGSAAAAASRPPSANAPARPRQRGTRPASSSGAYRRVGGAPWADARPSPRAFGAVGAGWAAGASRPHFERPYTAQPRVGVRRQGRQGTALSPRQQQQHHQIYHHQPPPPLASYAYDLEQVPLDYATPYSAPPSPQQPHSPRFCVHIASEGSAPSANSADADGVAPAATAMTTSVPPATTAAQMMAGAAPSPPPEAVDVGTGAPAPAPTSALAFVSPVEAHVRRLRASRGVPPPSSSATFPAQGGSDWRYRVPLAVSLLNDDALLRLQLEQYQLRHSGPTCGGGGAVPPSWDRIAVAEADRVWSGAWQPQKRPPLVSNRVRRTFEDEREYASEASTTHAAGSHQRRGPHARTGAAPSRVVHDAVASARHVGAQADSGPSVPYAPGLGVTSLAAVQPGEASPTPAALGSGGPKSAGTCTPRLAAAMAPQAELFGRPVQVDGAGIAAALAGTGRLRAPIA